MMRTRLFSAVLLLAVACNEPESEAPDASTPDANASAQPDSSQTEVAPDETPEVASGESREAVDPQDVPTELPAFPSGKPVFELTAEQAAALLAEDKNVVILDIRTPSEFEQGNIPGAINIDFRADDFRSKIEGLDRSTHYLVHCASGGRSRSSLEVFQELNFSRIYHLTKGYNAWTQRTQTEAP